MFYYRYLFWDRFCCSSVAKQSFISIYGLLFCVLYSILFWFDLLPNFKQIICNPCGNERFNLPRWNWIEIVQIISASKSRSNCKFLFTWELLTDVHDCWLEWFYGNGIFVSVQIVGMENWISNWMHIFKWIDWSKICVGWWLNDECLLIYCRMTQMKVCTNLIFIIRCWFFVNKASNANLIHAVNKQSNSANVDIF